MPGCELSRCLTSTRAEALDGEFDRKAVHVHAGAAARSGDAVSSAEPDGHGPPPLKPWVRVAHLVPRKGFKVFDPDELVCSFCRKKGHAGRFCVNEGVPLERVRVRPLSALDFVRSTFDARARTVRDVRRDAGMSLGELRVQLTERAARLNDGNPWVGTALRGEELKAHIGMWRAIGASRMVVRWLVGGVPLRMESEPQRMAFANARSCEEHADFVRAQMAKWVAAGAYAVVDGSALRVVNPLLVEPKKGKDGWRLVVDARYPNSFLPKMQFKLASAERDVPLVVRAGDRVFTVDLESAYYSVPLHEDAQKYMGWYFEGKYYMPRVLPFGVSLAPYVFVRTAGVLRQYLQRLGLRVVSYMDDFFVACEPERAREVAQFVAWLLRALGWRFSEKTALEPAPRAEFLGVTVDTARLSFEAVAAKTATVLKLVRQCQSDHTAGRPVTRAVLRTIAGKIVAMALAVPSARVWTRAMLREGSRELGEGIADVDAVMLEEWKYWVGVFGRGELPSMPFRSPEAEVEMHTDVSTVGWGAHMAGVEASGWIPAEYVGASSTARELSALVCAGEALKERLAGRRLRVVMDSRPAIINLTKGGGPKRDLCALVKRWSVFCEQNDVRPTYMWVKREENKLADALSRVHGSKWEVRASLRERLEARAGVTFGAIERGEPVLYAPDWNDVRTAVDECRRAGARACLVLPEWPGQPWWSACADRAEWQLRLSFDEAFRPGATRVVNPTWRFVAMWCDFGRGADPARAAAPETSDDGDGERREGRRRVRQRV